MEPPIEISSRLREWCDLWEVGDLASEITVEISSRMTRSLGRCYPDRQLVRIARFVTEESEELFTEVLCHEVAHVAAHHVHGRDIRPHGPEWKTLMAHAGYAPTVRFPESALSSPRPPKRRRKTQRTLLERLRCQILRRARSLAFTQRKV